MSPDRDPHWPWDHGCCDRCDREIRAIDGSWWLGVFGFALVGPAALEWAAGVAERVLLEAEGITYGVGVDIRGGP